MKRLTKTISGSFLGHLRKNRMNCLSVRERNHPTLLSSITGPGQREFTLRNWQEWLDAWERWMTGCCALRKAGGIA